jgi:hypothetical protein
MQAEQIWQLRAACHFGSRDFDSSASSCALSPPQVTIQWAMEPIKLSAEGSRTNHHGRLCMQGGSHKGSPACRMA